MGVYSSIRKKIYFVCKTFAMGIIFAVVVFIKHIFLIWKKNENDLKKIKLTNIDVNIINSLILKAYFNW